MFSFSWEPLRILKPIVALEAVEVLFSVIAFAILADCAGYPFWSHYQDGGEFFVAVGVVAMLASLFSLLLYLFFDLEEIFTPLVWFLKFSFTFVWTLMWFIASLVWAIYSNQSQFQDVNFLNIGLSCSQSRASAADAFGWFNFGIWSFHTFLIFLEYKKKQTPLETQKTPTYDVPSANHSV
eukprot:Sdes_comp21130_c0_seq1m19805